MKAGWEFKTLNQIAENLDFKRIPITKSDRNSGEYPYYGASGVVDFVADYIFDCDALLISEDGANLLARSTPIAFPVSGKYWVNNHAHILKFDSLTTQRFIELYFDSISLEPYITGAAQPKLNQSALNSIPIPVPPIQEQQRIVAILDEAFEQIAIARANTEKNLQNARALFESHLQSAFGQRGNGWIRQKLGEVVTLDKIQHKPSKPLPYVGMEDIESNTGNFLGRHEPKKVKSSTFYFNDTHVIYGRLRPYLNKVMLPDFEGHCSTEVFPLKPCHKIDRKFLFFWLALNSTKELINATCTGARMPRANMNDVLEFDFYYPELASQKKLVLILEALSLETQCLESLYQRKLTALDELKKSLLHKAFAGEL